MLDNSIASINKRLRECCEKVKEKSDDVELDFACIEDCLLQMPKYFNSIIHEEIGLTLANIRYADNPEMLKYTREQLDTNRRMCHICMTDGINILNRLCTMIGVEKIFQIEGDRVIDSNDLEDRELAADLCFNFCKDSFLDARTKEELWNKGFDHEATNRNERENELYQMIQSRLGFDENKVSETIIKLKGDEER